MIEVIPAILSASLAEIRRQLESICGSAPLVQLDVVDGKFAPSRTWPYSSKDRTEFDQVVSGSQGLPFWDEFDFEADLMVENALPDAKRWMSAGASRIIVHEGSKDLIDTIEWLQEFRTAPYPTSVGLSLSLGGSLDLLRDLKGKFDLVQVMGISHLGAQGQPLDEGVYGLIRDIRESVDVPLQIDGGVSKDNVHALVKAGVDRIVSGSAIFKKGDPVGNLRELIRIANV